MTRPPQPLRGHVEAAALLFDEGLLGRAEVARRVFAWWQPGVRLERTRAGVVMILPQPKRLAVSGAPGLPLVARGGALVGFAADDATLAALAPPAGALVLRREARTVVLADGRPESPADWLELGAVEVIETEALAEPAPPLVLAVAPPPTVHEALGPGVPAPAPEREQILREAASGEGGAERGASWLDRLIDGAGDLLGLNRLLGRQHARYVRRMMELLEGGDPREGLRRALPLASLKALFRGPSRRTRLFRPPSPRASLTITPGGVSSSGGPAFDGQLFVTLQQLYRKTFDRLDAQNRHEEAAFVLAELLQQDEEAVAYLERHGQLRRAAELAEARRCPPGLVVRAWFLAGDRTRAVRVARQRGAFHDALVRLERTHPQEARALRLLWADALADAGAYADAVATVAQLPEARALSLGWIDAGLELAEAQAPRLLAFEAALAPERWPRTRARAEAWLSGGDPVAAQRRRALAGALPGVPASAEVKLLARRCARACLAAAATDGSPIDGAALQALVRAAGDRALEADLPRDRMQREGWRSGPVVKGRLERSGAAPTRDAVVLPSGRILLAQGEAGVALLGPGGARLHHFDVPADRLVIADAGDRAIAVAQRGESAQLARLDLRRRQAAPWGLVRLGGFAGDYDGNVWFVIEGEGLVALDAQACEPRAFWSVQPQAQGEEDPFREPCRTPSQLVVLSAGWGLERWAYELPGLLLRERGPINLEGPGILLGIWPTVEGRTFALSFDPEGTELVLISRGADRHERKLGTPGEGSLPKHGAATADFCALVLSDGAGLRIRLFGPTLTEHATLDLPGASAATVRFAFRHLTVARHDGGLATLDLDRGTLRAMAPP